MSRITKNGANRIATTIANKKYGNRITVLREQLRKAVTAEYKSQLPPEVLKAFESVPAKAYIRCTSSVRFSGNGFANYEVFSIEPMPSAAGSYSTATIEPRKVAAPVIRKLSDRLKDMEKARNQLQIELEQSFLSLGTHKRIREEFKELSDYFPDNENVAIVRVYDDLHKKLKEKI